MDIQEELKKISQDMERVERVYTSMQYKEEQLTTKLKEDLGKLKEKGYDVKGVYELTKLRDACEKSIKEVIGIIRPKIDNVLKEENIK